MTDSHNRDPDPQSPLRLWPGAAAVAVQWLAMFVLPAIAPETAIYGILAAFACGLAVIIWWLFFSRASRADRVGGIAFAVACAVLTSQFLHESIATGMMGFLFPMYAIPVLSLALVAGAAAGSRLAPNRRRIAIAAAIVLACGAFTLLRTGGVTGDGNAEFAWRWSRTAEELLLAESGGKIAPSPDPSPASAPGKEDSTAGEAASPVPDAAPAAREKHPAEPATTPAATSAAATETAAAWPGFRGPLRDGIVRGVRIQTDWASSPPVELWRRRVGPGWSSFAVDGDRLYTQEQRGENEVVASYKALTGEPVWTHADKVRFWESNAGAGPRSTPALAHGRVYTLGATGILCALRADDGSVVWSRDAAADTRTEVPTWGFSSSPLVVGDAVVVAVSGQLVAYDAATGKPRWFGPKDGISYASPHRASFGGVDQILLLTEKGATSVTPSGGKPLWKHDWAGFASLQPAMTADGGILIASGGPAGGFGTRRLAITPGGSNWTVEEVWTSIGLKPYFNDLVVHKGHAYGFDGAILSCIDLQDGARKWKGGRFGHGQLILLADQDLLLVLAESGELALIRAEPTGFAEVARIPALGGKTWNHPVLAGDLLLIRNGEEMVALRLRLLGS